jgi:hypothetical protein
MAMDFKYLDFGGPVNFGSPVPLPRWHLAIDGPDAHVVLTTEEVS